MVGIETTVGKVLARRGLPSPTRRRCIREQAHLSQGDIAAALGVTWSAVSRWEAGLREPTGPNLIAYADLLDRLQRL